PPGSAPPQAPGDLGRLARYRILEVLGCGGVGFVFKAEDTKLHRLVALKIMQSGLADDAFAREGFLREARNAAAVTHDNIIPIHEVSEDGGLLYLAMALLKGETLDQRL